uniref:Lateral signaling target protein 2 homolog n=1 Tax=Timema bartmani TaxID=61472 RepID=A0A7R9F044_9NEOP|nr:unnamed protein product [Timema bartmani]
MVLGAAHGLTNRLSLVMCFHADQSWFSLLEGTRWLQHMAGLLRAALAVVSAVEQEGRPVLVHCSDGWDRTPQIVALAKLLLDPYYRTIEGFRILCENEWLDFGHKFADRCGHMIGCDDPNERCPVFLQWLDCVHQLLLQFPCAFEFSHSYLVLWPSCNVRNLVLWCEVYLGSVESTVNSVISSSLTTNETPKVDDVPGVPSFAPSLCKTRSCDNLLAAAEHSSGQQRRSSDPNVTRELVCANSRRCLADKDGSTSSSTSGKTSRYSTPPLYSQTPSSGYPATPNDERTLAPRLIHVGSRLDDVDGLAPLQNDVQVRVQQIIADHRAKEDALKQELYTTRLALIHQVCHHCSHANADRPDDGESRPESGCSGEQPSGESVRSDVSWETVEETDASPTLWVPDHAVNRCMGCDTEFWLGRRKHHCRNCGKIFCADCSENTVPLPNEQLYDPVRVCVNCFSMLHNSSTLLKRHRAIPFSSIEYSGSLNFVNDFIDYGSLTLKDDGAATADIALVDNCKPSNALVSDTEGKPPIAVISAASP